MVVLGGPARIEAIGNQVQLLSSRLVFLASTIGLFILPCQQISATLEAGLDQKAVVLTI